jgi:hypothetical protein
MPPRWVCVAIVACWLAVNGWLLWHDVWPAVRPGQAPPLSFDLVDEVELNQQTQTPWAVFVNGQEEPTYRAYTWVERQKAEDLYALRLRLAPETKLVAPGGKGLAGRLVRSASSTCRITPDKVLHDLSLEVGIEKFGVAAKAAVRGQVCDGQLFCTYRVEALGRALPFESDPVPVSHHGTVFVGLHPAQRIRGLYPGQTWRVPSLEVLSGGGLGRGAVRFLDARVLAEPQTLDYKGQQTTCLVIEYGEDEAPTRTWVEADGGRVLRQEITVDTERWAFQRER